MAPRRALEPYRKGPIRFLAGRFKVQCLSGLVSFCFSLCLCLYFIEADYLVFLLCCSLLELHLHPSTIVALDTIIVLTYLLTYLLRSSVISVLIQFGPKMRTEVIKTEVTEE